VALLAATRLGGKQKPGKRLSRLGRRHRCNAAEVAEGAVHQALAEDRDRRQFASGEGARRSSCSRVFRQPRSPQWHDRNRRRAITPSARAGIALRGMRSRRASDPGRPLSRFAGAGRAMEKATEEPSRPAARVVAHDRVRPDASAPSAPAWTASHARGRSAPRSRFDADRPCGSLLLSVKSLVAALVIRLSRLSGVRVPAGNTIDSPSIRRSSGPTRVGRIEIVALASRSGAA
jgi:hypothetical protein